MIQVQMFPPRDERREFQLREDRKFRAFSEGDGAVWRTYRCGCGFTTNSPGRIYDHALICDATPGGGADLDPCPEHTEATPGACPAIPSCNGDPSCCCYCADDADATPGGES